MIELITELIQLFGTIHRGVKRSNACILTNDLMITGFAKGFPRPPMMINLSTDL